MPRRALPRLSIEKDVIKTRSNLRYSTRCSTSTSEKDRAKLARKESPKPCAANKSRSYSNVSTSESPACRNVVLSTANAVISVNRRHSSTVLPIIIDDLDLTSSLELSSEVYVPSHGEDPEQSEVAFNRLQNVTRGQLQRCSTDSLPVSFSTVPRKRTATVVDCNATLDTHLQEHNNAEKNSSRTDRSESLSAYLLKSERERVLNVASRVSVVLARRIENRRRHYSRQSRSRLEAAKGGCASQDASVLATLPDSLESAHFTGFSVYQRDCQLNVGRSYSVQDLERLRIGLTLKSTQKSNYQPQSQQSTKKIALKVHVLIPLGAFRFQYPSATISELDCMCTVHWDTLNELAILPRFVDQRKRLQLAGLTFVDRGLPARLCYALLCTTDENSNGGGDEEFRRLSDWLVSVECVLVAAIGLGHVALVFPDSRLAVKYGFTSQPSNATTRSSYLHCVFVELRTANACNVEFQRSVMSNSNLNVQVNVVEEHSALQREFRAQRASILHERATKNMPECYLQLASLILSNEQNSHNADLKAVQYGRNTVNDKSLVVENLTLLPMATNHDEDDGVTPPYRDECVDDDLPAVWRMCERVEQQTRLSCSTETRRLVGLLLRNSQLFESGRKKSAAEITRTNFYADYGVLNDVDFDTPITVNKQGSTLPLRCLPPATAFIWLRTPPDARADLVRRLINRRAARRARQHVNAGESHHSRKRQPQSAAELSKQNASEMALQVERDNGTQTNVLHNATNTRIPAEGHSVQPEPLPIATLPATVEKPIGDSRNSAPPNPQRAEAHTQTSASECPANNCRVLLMPNAVQWPSSAFAPCQYVHPYGAPFPTPSIGNSASSLNWMPTYVRPTQYYHPPQSSNPADRCHLHALGSPHTPASACPPPGHSCPAPPYPPSWQHMNGWPVPYSWPPLPQSVTLQRYQLVTQQGHVFSTVQESAAVSGFGIATHSQPCSSQYNATSTYTTPLTSHAEPLPTTDVAKRSVQVQVQVETYTQTASASNDPNPSGLEPSTQFESVGSNFCTERRKRGRPRKKLTPNTEKAISSHATHCSTSSGAMDCVQSTVASLHSLPSNKSSAVVTNSNQTKRHGRSQLCRDEHQKSLHQAPPCASVNSTSATAYAPATASRTGLVPAQTCASPVTFTSTLIPSSVLHPATQTKRLTRRSAAALKSNSAAYPTSTSKSKSYSPTVLIDPAVVPCVNSSLTSTRNSAASPISNSTLPLAVSLTSTTASSGSKENSVSMTSQSITIPTPSPTTNSAANLTLNSSSLSTTTLTSDSTLPTSSANHSGKQAQPSVMDDSLTEPSSTTEVHKLVLTPACFLPASSKRVLMVHVPQFTLTKVVNRCEARGEPITNERIAALFDALFNARLSEESFKSIADGMRTAGFSYCIASQRWLPVSHPQPRAAAPPWEQLDLVTELEATWKDLQSTFACDDPFASISQFDSVDCPSSSSNLNPEAAVFVSNTSANGLPSELLSVELPAATIAPPERAPAQSTASSLRLKAVNRVMRALWQSQGSVTTNDLMEELRERSYVTTEAELLDAISSDWRLDAFTGCWMPK